MQIATCIFVYTIHEVYCRYNWDVRKLDKGSDISVLMQICCFYQLAFISGTEQDKMCRGYRYTRNLYFFVCVSIGGPVICQIMSLLVGRAVRKSPPSSASYVASLSYLRRRFYFDEGYGKGFFANLSIKIDQ